MGQINKGAGMEWIPGAIIYGKPTGNNARHKGGLVEFEVVKMKRKYVDLKEVGSRHVESYLPSNGATKQAVTSGHGNNSGYDFYQTKDEYEDSATLERQKSFVKKHFGTWPDGEVSDDQYKRIYHILTENK